MQSGGYVRWDESGKPGPSSFGCSSHTNTPRYCSDSRETWFSQPLTAHLVIAEPDALGFRRFRELIGFRELDVLELLGPFRGSFYLLRQSSTEPVELLGEIGQLAQFGLERLHVVLPNLEGWLERVPKFVDLRRVVLHRVS
jgi:hypothetical protein